MKVHMPKEMLPVRARVERFIFPIKSADNSTKARNDFLLRNIRAVDSNNLPHPYLIYFMLVELLNFKDLGQFEKLAWSIPLDYLGKAFLIEHRKFGVGIFVQDESDTDAAIKIAKILGKSAAYARPYYKWKADEAIRNSKFNVTNNSRILLERYYYFKKLYDEKITESQRRKDEKIVTKHKSGMSVRFPVYELRREANWLSMSAIDAFFSWTEHFFVHTSIVKSAISTGDDFSALSAAEWRVKYKRALDISDKNTKKHFDNLAEIRRQLRNFVAHGAFGKSGETLHFHSAAGAVPVILDVTHNKPRYAISEGLAFNAEEAFKEIEEFIAFMSSGDNELSWLYVQEWCLPSIISMASDGSYARAMGSLEDMRAFVEYLAQQMDNAANMDW